VHKNYTPRASFTDGIELYVLEMQQGIHKRIAKKTAGADPGVVANWGSGDIPS